MHAGISGAFPALDAVFDANCIILVIQPLKVQQLSGI
jgi:hypothetical protein